MIPRAEHLRRLNRLLRQFPVVGILGARQVGKTTLARQLGISTKGPVHHFDLEDPRDVARLEDPMLALADLRGLVVLDEVQHRPELFPALRVLADRRPRRARFVVLGSVSPDLSRQSAETLAGRIHYHYLEELTLPEVGSRHVQRLWLRGGFPSSFVARSDADSFRWRSQFVETFLHRDLPRLGITVSPETLRRFWSMLAHYHGQILNAAELGNSLGVSPPTITRYLDLLSSTFVVRRLRPWHENMKKRQVKASKVYLRDVGLLHALLNLPTRRDLEGHPKVGASWEGFAMSEIVACLGARWDECWFWATHQGAKLDLLFVRGRKRLGFELKRSSAPRMTPSMRIATSDLGLSRLFVVHPGKDAYALADKATAVPITQLASVLSGVPKGAEG